MTEAEFCKSDGCQGYCIDQRSSASSLSLASLILWPRTEGPFADLIRRGKRRLVLFLAIATIATAIAVAVFRGA